MNPNNAARSSASEGLNIIATAQIPGFTTAQQPTHATDLTTEIEALQALPAGTTYDLVGATSRELIKVAKDNGVKDDIIDDLLNKRTMYHGRVLRPRRFRDILPEMFYIDRMIPIRLYEVNLI